eukprot:6181207-Pleurochrysis_carterae.AAC.5
MSPTVRDFHTRAIADAGRATLVWALSQLLASLERILPVSANAMKHRVFHANRVDTTHASSNATSVLRHLMR